MSRTAVPESPSVPNFPFLRVRRKRGPDVISLAFSQASSASAADPTTGFTSSGRIFPLWFVFELASVYR